MLVLATCFVLAGASQAMAQHGLAGTLFSQTYSPASGVSRVVFKRTAGKGSADLDAFALIDPCGDGFGVSGPGLEVDITNSLVGLYGVTLAAPSAPWLRTCRGYNNRIGGTDRSYLDTGNCKIRLSVTWTRASLIPASVVRASVKASCSLPFPVAPTADAYLQFVMSTPSGLDWHPMCFLASGPGAATVLKDGSDGKHVRMTNAPLCP